MRSSILMILAIVGTWASSSYGQSTLDHPVGQLQPYNMDSGTRNNEAEAFATVFEDVVLIKDAAWLRIYFGEVTLTDSSYIRMTSLLDGEVQELDERALAMWSNSSAYFNGDAVQVELIAGPGTKGNSVIIEQVAVHMGTRQAAGGSGQCGICGSDDRVPSSETWSARLFPAGCTASVWNTESCMVSAGHCVGGNMVMQFNVPDSNSNCSTNNPPISDQFPVVSVQYTNGGVGNDWSVMTTGTNNVSQTAYERYGELRPISEVVGSPGQTTGLWGYGVDNTCTRSQTQQTASGPIQTAPSTFYTFSVDLRGGNSGSGLILNDEIIGIVTHCPCPNVATKVNHAAFTAAREALCPGEVGTTPLPFFDDFPTTTINPDLWIGIDGATIDDNGAGEPSPSFSLNLDLADEIRSAFMDTSDSGLIVVSYWWQRTGDGGSPEPGEDLFVEYANAVGTWIELNTHPGDGPDDDPYQFVQIELPGAAHHTEFRLRFRTTGTFIDDDWFVDDVFVGTPPEDATTTLPFIDEFPTTEINADLWIGIEGASIDEQGAGEPSPPYSLNIDGVDEIRSANMDTTGGTDLTLNYSWQQTGDGGNTPEEIDPLMVEYFNNQGDWVEINSHPGGGPDAEPYEPVSLPLPADALHGSFRIRFRGTGTTGGQPAGFDDWFIDDVCIGTAAECPGATKCSNDGDPCDDGDPCTDNDICTTGSCGGTAVDCSGAGDQCNTASCSPDGVDGNCDDLTPVANGTLCSDSDACTENDQCTAGNCGGTAVDCSGAGDQCNTASCDSGGAEGNCDNLTPLANGTPCNDSDACTENDQCTAGSCGGTAVDCSGAGDQCNTASCDSGGAEGNCDNLTPVANGTPCNDSDACTENDQCTAGSCGGTAVDCSAAGDQCNTASCDVGGAEGNCDTLTPVADETQCNDSNACTENDQCTAGSCGGTAVDCSGAGDQCNTASCDVGGTEGNCDALTPVADETQCNDDDACTENDQCTAGNCGGMAVDCSGAGDQCNTASCDPGGAEGNCDDLTPVADETQCGDSNACTENDQCTAGNCGGTAVDCSAAGDQCNTASCDSGGAEGNCDTLSPVADETQCSDEDACTENDQCTAGSCAGTAIDCSEAGDQCNVASCDPGGGEGNCDDLTPAEDGSPCEDNDLCTIDDECSSGDCIGGVNLECPEGEVCAPETGECAACGPCPTDVDGDGQTAAFDLAVLLGCWGTVTPGTVCECLEVDGDMAIGAFDLAFLLGAWGACE